VGFLNIADRFNQLQTCYFLLHRRREEGDRTDLGRDYEGAGLCPCGGDSRLCEVIAINIYIAYLFYGIMPSGRDILMENPYAVEMGSSVWVRVP
jgi:hypothetical protein